MQSWDRGRHHSFQHARVSQDDDGAENLAAEKRQANGACKQPTSASSQGMLPSTTAETDDRSVRDRQVEGEAASPSHTEAASLPQTWGGLLYVNGKHA